MKDLLGDSLGLEYRTKGLSALAHQLSFFLHSSITSVRTLIEDQILEKGINGINIQKNQTERATLANDIIWYLSIRPGYFYEKIF